MDMTPNELMGAFRQIIYDCCGHDAAILRSTPISKAEWLAIDERFNVLFLLNVPGFKEGLKEKPDAGK